MAKDIKKTIKQNDIVSRECRHVTHLPYKEGYRKDTHIIKEILHYEDGTSKKNLRIVEDYKRPFWITKPYYQKHKQKKESEELTKLNKYTCTQSDMPTAIASRLGSKYVGCKTMRDVSSSPYLYGSDISSNVIIKQEYMTAFPDTVTDYHVVGLDLEWDVVDDWISVITIMDKDRMLTVINSRLINERGKALDEVLHRLYEKYVPDSKTKNSFKRQHVVLDSELSMIKLVFKELHIWQPDFVTTWSLDADIPKMTKVIEDNGLHPKDIYCDPNLPNNLKYFRYIEGGANFKSESGKFKPLSPHEKWSYAIFTASFFFIDAMATYYYVRVGGKVIPGGFSLDNVIKQELGDKFGKLKFGDDPKYKGIDWHIYMSQNKPKEYVTYNQYDVQGMMDLLEHTKDLSIVASLLSGPSEFYKFKSGPKKLLDRMHFFYMDRGRVLGTKAPIKDKDQKTLSLSNWIK